ncbi:MAG: type VI secretion system protein TssA [Methylicorpusculum sp.]|uniref:type VI secretion system protein TssA n=1 Tax=Methylicorpusculum sp. TaxID=2713644 RepID=UPI00272623E0|nr:type VI secretion system protein TssA [Methylicorpusculum sp.]MDO8843651.1 type VI secretion system protein TssA [Methylicorpusculum sp.]MDO8939970.1 type VI secretion system protein TssA [Methylicorpusculum sp.]MDO9240955.1 type VI secretion system protein TssA [Methylicorpusculum sp.]MDP2203001.1 type VI secretion system protein TssA [Methylicorpusculum sp.]
MSIDIEKYVQDVDPDNVCGDDLEYDPDFIALEKDIKGKPEQQIGDTLVEAEPPNWREIKKSAEALLERTRDLRVLVYYLRSLIAVEGVSGFHTGLKLIETLVQQRWDSLYPRLDPDDDNDPTERVNILMSLCDQETILRPLQSVPLVESKAIGRFTLRDVLIATEKLTVSKIENPVSLSTIEAAIQDTDSEALQQKQAWIAQGLESLNSLEKFVTQEVGISNAPNFDELRHLLKDIKGLMSNWLDTLGVSDSVDSDETEVSDSDDKPKQQAAQKSISGAINNNQDVINTLKLICDYYKKNEPSSPVPIFLERALRLVGKSFMDALKDIAPDGVSQANLIRGVRDEEDE